MIAQHMRFNRRHLASNRRLPWTRRGLDGPAALRVAGLMRGSAEVSSGGSDEMERLKGALAKDPAAREILASGGDPAQVLANLRSSRVKQARRSPATSTWSATASLTASTLPSPRRSKCRKHSSRLSASPFPEKPRPPRTSMPALPKSAPRSPPATGPSSTKCSARPASPTASATSVASTAISGPRPHAARRPCGWQAGSPSRGRLATPYQMLDASLDEMCALVAGTGGPSADDLASRAEYRAAYTAKDVPPFLGPPKPPPPDLTAPAAIGRSPHARDLHLFGPPLRQLPGAERGKGLHGLAASKGVYQGPARRVSGPSEFGRIARGGCARHRVDDRGLQTSSYRSLAGLSPTTAASFHMRRSSRASMASPASSGPARRPNASPTASLSASTGMLEKSPCSREREKGRPLHEGARDIALRIEGRGTRRRLAPGPPGPPWRGALGRPGRGRRLGGGQGHLEKVAKAIAALPPRLPVRSSRR